MRRGTVGALVMLAVLAPGGTAFAHTGTSGTATSNYRTRVTAVQPAVPDLSVRVADLDGRITLTYTGPGTIVVEGYEGEPYLRFSPTGVERNRHSPATYLNTDRYAQVAQPATADASAPPDWETLSSGHTYTWHDHRTHWMSPTPPTEVVADPDREVVIFDRWVIPLEHDGAAVSVVGDLRWLPPPSALPWILVAAVGALALLGLLFRPRWQRTAALLAVAGAVVCLIDSLGYLARSTGRLDNRLLVLAAPAVVGLAAWRCWVRRDAAHPAIAISIASLVLAVLGGIDRSDTFDHSLIATALPAWGARLAAATCLAIGAALLVRFLVFLLPAAFSRPAVPARASTG